MGHAATLTHGHLRAHARTHMPPARRRKAAESGLDWEASGWAGLVAGAAFVVLETSFVTMFNGDARVDAVRQVAAIALGESSLPPSDSFTGLVFFAAMGVHMILSLFYARILAMIVHGLSAPRAVAIGAGFGAALYAVNFYLFTNIFPWFQVSRGWITLFVHVAFGMIAAGVYERLTAAKRPPSRSPILY